MKLYLDCYACVVRQTLQVCRSVGVSEEDQVHVLRTMLCKLHDADPTITPPEMGAQMHALIRELVDVEDPYQEEKKISTAEALSYYPSMKKKVERADDPFETAVRLAIAGNIIDFGVHDHYDLQGTIQQSLIQPLAINHLSALRAAVKRAETILYLADNAGETVFDRLLIETINKPVIYAVKDAPVLNDATMADAKAAGVDRVARVISCGARSPGTILERCSEDFVALFDKADVIIAKGQGNYEALSSERGHIFFLLKAKCVVISKDLGVPVGSMVVKKR